MFFIVFVEDSRVEYGEVEGETETRAIKARADDEGGHGSVGCAACVRARARLRAARRVAILAILFRTVR